MNSQLTAQQQKFVAEYLASEDLNATQAAIRAGYSKATATVQASRLMKHPLVAAAVKKAMDERAQRTQLDADFVLSRLRKIADDVKLPAASRVRALQLLGQHILLFRPDDIPAQGDGPIQVIEVACHAPQAPEPPKVLTFVEGAEVGVVEPEKPPPLVAQPEKSLAPPEQKKPAPRPKTLQEQEREVALWQESLSRGSPHFSDTFPRW